MARKTLDMLVPITASVNQDFERSVKRSWRALFAPGDDENFVIANCGFAINTPHPTYPALVITNIELEREAAAVTCPTDNTLSARWQIDLTYGTWNPLEHAIDGNPLHLPVTFTFVPSVEEVPAFEDVDGDPIVNAAGDPYDPPLMRRVQKGTLTVKRNESPFAVNLYNLQVQGNTTNLASWNGFPPKTLLLEPIKIPEILFSQVTQQFYFPFEYVFLFDPDTWVKQIVNAGLRALNAAGQLVPILIQGQPASQPVPLDEQGRAITEPSFADSEGDTPPDANSGGNADDASGGGEPPEGGDGTDDGGSLTNPQGEMIIDAYDLIRTADWSWLNMPNLFTLPVF